VYLANGAIVCKSIFLVNFSTTAPSLLTLQRGDRLLLHTNHNTILPDHANLKAQNAEEFYSVEEMDMLTHGS